MSSAAMRCSFPALSTMTVTSPSFRNFNPVIAMELLSSGDWAGSGVLGPEAFDPDPYLALLDRYGIHHAMVEMEPGAHRPT